MIKSVRLAPSIASRPRSLVQKVPALKIRCAVSVPREPTPKKAPMRPALIGAPSMATCFINKSQAHEFNQCYINFDRLDEEGAHRCVMVADDILAAECDTSICDDEVCTEKAQVDWFKGYMSNAFGF